MPAWLLRVTLALLLAAPAGPAGAGPWLEPGDLALRHDLTLLADAGLLRTPITTWPVSWPDVLRDVGATPDSALDRATGAALERVRQAARAAAQRGFGGAGYEIAGAERPTLLRDFADTPREAGQVTVGGSWLGDRFAAGLRATVVADPADQSTVRLDGSYVGATIGNVKLSAGMLERWWGPGWDASLILSSNARPMPQLTMERNFADPSPRPVLRWLGPWRATVSMGQAEGSGVAVPDVRFFAARVAFKPRPWLEFGLSRTAQWCGQGRPCDAQAFVDLLVGRDNSAELGGGEEPGNQMAGYDFRLRSPWGRLPVALYGQLIGEDEAGGLPSKYVGLLGAEAWGSSSLGSWRVRAEYADTNCDFISGASDFPCRAFRNDRYPQGYAYRGRVMAHSMDNDGRSLSVAALLVRESGAQLSLKARRLELNRDGVPEAAHATSPRGSSSVNDYELAFGAARQSGGLSVGIGYDDASSGFAGGSGLRGFLHYRKVH